MPIITVELVGAQRRDRERPLAQSLANAIARALHADPGQTWVRVKWLRRDDYAESETSVGADELPVFVGVLKRLAPVGAELEAEVAALTEVIAREVGRPAHLVHIEYAPSAAGRVSFGGSLVE